MGAVEDVLEGVAVLPFDAQAGGGLALVAAVDERRADERGERGGEVDLLGMAVDDALVVEAGARHDEQRPRRVALHA